VRRTAGVNDALRDSLQRASVVGVSGSERGRSFKFRDEIESGRADAILRAKRNDCGFLVVYYFFVRTMMRGNNRR